MNYLINSSHSRACGLTFVSENKYCNISTHTCKHTHTHTHRCTHINTHKATTLITIYSLTTVSNEEKITML